MSKQILARAKLKLKLTGSVIVTFLNAATNVSTVLAEDFQMPPTIF